MSQWDYKVDQPIPGPFPFPNLRKSPGIEVVHWKVFLVAVVNNYNKTVILLTLVVYER